MEKREFRKRELAMLAHALWSSWMRWMFECGFTQPNGSYVIPLDKVERWKKQMNTDFSKLTEEEQRWDWEAVEECMGKEK